LKSEQQIQTEILNYLNYEGAFVFKTLASNKGGIPDIVGVMNGQFIAIEVKKPGGRPTALQLVQIRKIKEAGGLACIAYDLETVKDYVNHLMES